MIHRECEYEMATTTFCCLSGIWAIIAEDNTFIIAIYHGCCIFLCSFNISAGKMPSLVKIFVECGRDLPVMDRNTVSAESSTGRTKQT